MSSRKVLRRRSDAKSFPLSLHRLQQCFAAQKRYYTFHVVGEHIECHLGRNLVSSSHQEMRRTHPSLYGPERMLCRLTAQGHLIGVLIEPLLNLLQHILVLPTRDAPLGASRALSLERAVLASGRPVAAQPSAMLLNGEPIRQPFTSRTAVDVLGRNIDEVLLAKTTCGFCARGQRFGNVTVMPAASQARISWLS
jgi:hypothetical protein